MRWPWCNPFFPLLRNTHYLFIWVKFGMVSVILKEDHVLKPVPTTGTHSCPTWEYPSELWSRDLRRTSLPCGLAPTTNVNTAGQWLDRAVPFGEARPCSVWRIERLAQLDEAHYGSTYVMCCPTFFLWCLWWNFFCLSALRCKSWVQRPNLWWVAISHVWV